MKEALEEADSSRILHTIDAPNDPGYLSVGPAFPNIYFISCFSGFTGSPVDGSSSHGLPGFPMSTDTCSRDLSP